MFKTKSLAGIFVVMALLFTQVGTVFAAPAAQEGTTTTISGAITNIEVQTNESGETVVVVTLEGYQAITLTAQQAADNGLYDLDTGELLVQVGDTVDLVVDPTVVVPEEEVPVHPIVDILASFFEVDPVTVNQYHLDGFGFGVIAQALWMSTDADGNTNTELATDILAVKQDKDFDLFFTNHPEYLEQFGDDLPTNWGQFKKGLLDKKNNLGMIVSGHAENEDSGALQEHGRGRGNGNGHGNGNGNGNRP